MRACFFDLHHLAIVIVGNRATIEGPLKATGIAPIVNLDIEANPHTSKSKSDRLVSLVRLRHRPFSTTPAFPFNLYA